jgi:hypothetical protein
MTPNTDNPDKPNICKCCGSIHLDPGISELINDHLFELIDNGQPDKPDYCEHCGRDHAVDALIQEHLDELFDNDKPPANQGDELDDLRFDLRLTERQLEELEAGKTYYLPLTDNLRAAVLFLHHRQLAERLQELLKKLPKEYSKQRIEEVTRSTGSYKIGASRAFGYNEALDDVVAIIRELMP